MVIFLPFTNLVVEPLAVLGRSRVDVLHGVESAGLFRVAVGVIHLRLEAGIRPTLGLILGVEVMPELALGRS